MARGVKLATRLEGERPRLRDQLHGGYIKLGEAVLLQAYNDGFRKDGRGEKARAWVWDRTADWPGSFRWFVDVLHMLDEWPAPHDVTFRAFTTDWMAGRRKRLRYHRGAR